MSTHAEDERRSTIRRVVTSFRLSEDPEASSFQSSLYSTGAGATQSEVETLDGETGTLERTKDTLKAPTDTLKYASRIPAGPLDKGDHGIYSSQSFGNARGFCSLATFFRYAPQHHFVMYVHGWDESLRQERTDYLAIRIGKNEESEEDVVRSTFQQWVTGLDTLGEKCVEEAWAELAWMSSLSSWKEIKGFMRLSKLQKLRDEGWNRAFPGNADSSFGEN